MAQPSKYRNRNGIDLYVKGDGSWKQLFLHPESLTGLRAEKDAVIVNQVKVLAQAHPLHPTKLYAAIPAPPVPELDQAKLFHIEEDPDGMTAEALLASLEFYNVLGACLPAAK